MSYTQVGNDKVIGADRIVSPAILIVILLCRTSGVDASGGRLTVGQSKLRISYLPIVEEAIDLIPQVYTTPLQGTVLIEMHWHQPQLPVPGSLGPQFV